MRGGGREWMDIFWQSVCFYAIIAVGAAGEFASDISRVPTTYAASSDLRVLSRCSDLPSTAAGARALATGKPHYMELA